ncbi:MAG: hypothetical protein ACAH88_20790, partial [Roseimicrobium sp.]
MNPVPPSLRVSLSHLVVLLAWMLAVRPSDAATQHFGIHVVDETTGRGIPLIELRTVNDLRYVTDNAGWIAFYEPGLMEREVWFYVNGPGYEGKKDGFGFTGVRFTPKSGETTTVKLKRNNIAERIGRLTGQGQYNASELLGLPLPLPNLNPSGVMGQDSVQAVPYKDHIFWLWGDTNMPNYPLGNYHTTCATTPRDIDPEKGIAFQYFMDKKDPKRLRKMMPMEGPGAVWLFGLLTVKDENGQEVLLAHYGRHEGLKPHAEHGIARFDDAEEIFKSAVKLDLANEWRYMRGHAVLAEDGYFYFSSPLPHTRVRATLGDVLDPAKYEALWFDQAKGEWLWQKEQAPTTQEAEQILLKQEKMKLEQARFDIRDADTGTPVILHNASMQWSAWRKRWILVGVQYAFTGKSAPSPLGEMWYAESEAPGGPWSKAVKVATHPRYSYYNPIHHGFLDKEGGKVIYFEGTYTLEFSGNPLAPARYDYNQLMY